MPVRFGLSQKRHAGRLEPRGDLVRRLSRLGRWIVDAGVCDDRKKLVEAGPRYRPCDATLGQIADAARRGLVPLRVLAVRVDQQIRVESDQEPRPR
jgi:hypothetical protein